MLKARMRADLRVYRDAVGALEANRGTTFEKAHKLAEIARICFEAARDRFHAHVSSHRCEVCYIRYRAEERSWN
jgi:hypothetical protein